MSGKKYFISGGGTGGHIYPAFTVVEKLLKNEDTEKIYFVGNPENLEFETVKKYPEVEFLPIKIHGMPRKFTPSFIKWVVDFVIASKKTVNYMKKYEPDAIFTTGGYVSSPVIAAAKILKKPYMIHDCDSMPGLVSKIAAPGAAIVSVAFENSGKILKSNNIIFNGNPVRDAFFEITKETARTVMNIPEGKKVVYITGGSQGAQTLNSAACEILKRLSIEYNAFVILQTGKNKFYDVLRMLENKYPEYEGNPNILVKPYFEESVYPLKAADITVSRAGSLSLSEIISCNCPSILIPYPYAAQDHQRKNAKEMCEKGVSLYLEDADCNAEHLLSKIEELITNEQKLNEMREKTKEVARENPTDKIVEQLKSTIK